MMLFSKRQCQLFFLPLLLLLQYNSSWAQNNVTVTRQDTLMGSVTTERAWWDLTYYHLDVQVFPEEKFLKGSNTIQYTVLKPHQIMQIDLQAPLKITKVLQNGRKLKFSNVGDVWYITLATKQTKGKTDRIQVFYEGQPKIAIRPPWDGGIQWEKDADGHWLIATSCQGVGASIWWPCKDHMYDEPDSMRISATVPVPLMDVSNGRLESVKENTDLTRTFTWVVRNPINNYGVNLNIGNYSYWHEQYAGEKGPLDVSYYALPHDLEKAKKQFRQVPMMLKAFEYWFGPYPFYEDGYKLVQVPYLGMEHQSSVTYGNKFENGYLGRDLSGTGWGLKWDFIIIHESGHEWFANNITYRDIADMWVHESFTNYSEALFVEYYYGKQAATEYIAGLRKGIQNQARIMGRFGINSRGSGDMYSKGGNMLHTIRKVIDDDEKWRQILRGLNKDFYHQTVDGSQIRQYISEHSEIDFSKVFIQYLEEIQIPLLEYYWKDTNLFFRWKNVIDGFDMPIDIQVGENNLRIKPFTQWQSIALDKADIQVDINYYVNSVEILQSPKD
jgi:aminopeptidase N